MVIAVDGVKMGYSHGGSIVDVWSIVGEQGDGGCGFRCVQKIGL